MSDDRGSGTMPVRHRVIVADDHADARRLLTVALGGAGYDVTEAHDGAELYDLLTTSTPGYFRLVVTDQAMPRMLGVEVLARAGSRAPFIIVTGAPEDAARRAAEHLGAAAFFTKPVDVYALLRAVRRVLSGKTPPNGTGRPRESAS